MITNQFDVLNRLTNVLSVNGYQIGFGYQPDRPANEHDRPEWLERLPV